MLVSSFVQFVLVLLGCSLVRTVVGLNLTSTGSTVVFNGIPYYIPGTPYASVPNFRSQTLAGRSGLLGGLTPVTVVGANSVDFDLQSLESKIEEFGQKDDVWAEGFLSGMYSYV